NTNIAWHFQIAFDYYLQEKLQKRNITFAQAYQATQPRYKKIRIEDRRQAILSFLSYPEYYTSELAYLYDCMQIWIHKSNEPAIAVLESSQIKKLMEPFIRDAFTEQMDELIHLRIIHMKNKYKGTKYENLLSEDKIPDLKKQLREQHFALKEKVLKLHFKN